MKQKWFDRYGEEIRSWTVKIKRNWGSKVWKEKTKNDAWIESLVWIKLKGKIES